MRSVLRDCTSQWVSFRYHETFPEMAIDGLKEFKRLIDEREQRVSQLALLSSDPTLLAVLSGLETDLLLLTSNLLLIRSGLETEVPYGEKAVKNADSYNARIGDLRARFRREIGVAEPHEE